MSKSKLDLLQGTLDLMMLETLVSMGPQHGYGIARRIETISGNEVLLNQGTIYASQSPTMCDLGRQVANQALTNRLPRSKWRYAPV